MIIRPPYLLNSRHVDAPSIFRSIKQNFDIHAQNKYFCLSLGLVEVGRDQLCKNLDLIVICMYDVFAETDCRTNFVPTGYIFIVLYITGLISL